MRKNCTKYVENHLKGHFSGGGRNFMDKQFCGHLGVAEILSAPLNDKMGKMLLGNYFTSCNALHDRTNFQRFVFHAA